MEIDRKNKVLPRANRIIKQSLPLASLSRCGTNSCAGIKTETQQVVVLSDGAIRRSSAFVLLDKRIFEIRSPIGRTKMINGAHDSDRKSVVSGKSVSVSEDLGGCRRSNKKKNKK